MTLTIERTTPCGRILYSALTLHGVSEIIGLGDTLWIKGETTPPEGTFVPISGGKLRTVIECRGSHTRSASRDGCPGAWRYAGMP